LTRRRPGQSNISTQRKEADEVQILSGVFDGQTLGTPISLVVWNRDQRSKDYGHMETTYRPSHADYTYQAKYGIRNWKGGGRSSARETIGRVAAGAVAEKILQSFYGIEIVAWVDQVRDIVAAVDGNTVSREDVEANVARCPDEAIAQVMIDRIKAARKAGDSLGGIVEAVVRGLPAGWGEPVFDKIDADLAKAMLSLPACKGFEVGSGFGGIALSGAEHNDTFYMDGDRVRTKTNRSGGVQGGITNGENLTMRAAFKPTATIIKEQDSVNEAGEDVQFKGRGRHDPCVLPRAVPIVEAMIALTLIDHAMRQQAIQHPASE
jgi:chorismate synthase